MIADILLQRGHERWVLDAKYKCDFGKRAETTDFKCAPMRSDSMRVRLRSFYPHQGVQQPIYDDFSSAGLERNRLK